MVIHLLVAVEVDIFDCFGHRTKLTVLWFWRIQIEATAVLRP